MILSNCKWVSGGTLFPDIWIMYAVVYSPRTWDCPQHEAEVAARTHPVTICIRTDINLRCALNVAAS